MEDGVVARRGAHRQSLVRQAVRVRAPAKINLLLRVLGLRADGFHELETLFQAIDLTDELTVELAGDSVDLEVAGTDAGPVTHNLAFRAAEAFRLAADLHSGVRILLTKNIPTGAGLGGGSSDAAAVLRALNHLTGGAVAAEALLAIGADLGSDVPFFCAAARWPWLGVGATTSPPLRHFRRRKSCSSARLYMSRPGPLTPRWQSVAP